MINSDKPIDESKLAPTLLENDSPALVKTGRPAHKASFAVVMALKGIVSINKSAHLCLAR